MANIASAQVSSKTPAAKNQRMDPKSLGRLIIGIVFLIGSVGYLVMALGMPQGSLDSPGPGLFPVGVGIVSVVVSIIVILESVLRKGPSGAIDVPKGFERRQAFYFLGTFIMLVVLLPILGQYIASSLYVVLTLRLLGGLSWIRSVIFGIVMALAITALFGEVLSVPLPGGIW